MDAARCARVTFLEHQVRELEDLASDPLVRKAAPNAVVSARSKASDLRAQLDELKASKRRRRPRKTSEDAAAEVLEETRRLRMAAAEAGSFVAAANLLKLERDLLAAHRAEQAERERERLSQLDEAALVEMLVDHLLSLPTQVRERVRVAVYAPAH